jgi:hypothetical protein
MSHFLDYLDDPADKDLQNEIVGEVWDLMRQLKARGLLARRLPLLASDDLTVRREAALESVVRDGTYPPTASSPARRSPDGAAKG